MECNDGVVAWGKIIPVRLPKVRGKSARGAGSSNGGNFALHSAPSRRTGSPLRSDKRRYSKSEILGSDPEFNFSVGVAFMRPQKGRA